jgi:Tol biopolymer transport system component
VAKNPEATFDEEAPVSDRLDSWKEIAGYLKRDVSTVQRWEKREGLPVHRHVHARLGSLYAFKSELDAWWRNGSDRIERSEAIGSGTSETAPTLEFEVEATAPEYPGADSTQPQSGPKDPAKRPRAGERQAVAATGVLIIALATTWVIGYRMGARGANGSRVEPPPSFLTLTSRRGYVSQARFAPDGKTVIYSAAWDGQPLDVYLTRVDSIESRSLGLPNTAVLAISPKGELAISVGCRYDHAGLGCLGTLARVPLAGGAPRSVVEHVRQADWSPDGIELAAVIEDPIQRTFRLEYPLGRVLYTSPPDGWIGYPRVSPSGELIAFFDHPRGYGIDGTVAIIDATGHKTTLSSGYAMSHGIAWSPKGDEVWFSAAGPGGFALRAVSLSGEHRFLWRNPGPFDLDDVSREGKALVTLIDVRVGAVGVPAEARGERDLSWLGWTDASDLSTDGKLLLFYEHGYRSVREGPADLYLWRMDGRLPVRLGEGAALGLSPDAQWAISLKGTPAPTLILVPTGPGRARPLPRGAISWYDLASWLPDARRIVFSAREPSQRPRCYVQDVNGGLPRPITPEGIQTADIRRLLPTPDGHFVAAEDLHHRLALYPVDGGSPRSLPGVEPDDDPIQWSADQQLLYVRAAGKFPARIYRIDLATGHRVLWKELMPADPAAVIDVSDKVGRVLMTPDGGKYVYSYIRWLGEVELMEGLK